MKRQIPWIAMALALNVPIFAEEQSTLEDTLEKEREKTYQYGGEIPEEKAYYEKVDPKNVPSGQKFYQKNHPLEEAPLQQNSIPDNPLPENRIPDNPIPDNPI